MHTSADELTVRLHRIYAAVDATIEGDLAKFPPSIVESEEGFALYQNFLGGLNEAQIANLAQSEIGNIAHLKDHLRGWCKRNGHDPQVVEDAINGSPALQVIVDLSNRDKHGGEKRDDRSGKGPRLAFVTRGMRMKTAPVAGSFVRMTITRDGPKVEGSGKAEVVIDGMIVDRGGERIGLLDTVCAEAVKAWEDTLQKLGVQLPG